MRDRLAGRGVTIAAMESASTYWKAPFYCLNEVVETWMLNAAHIKAVPGRKTDVRDAEWIAQLLEHGLVRPSFVPPADIRRLRMLTRYRVQLMGDRNCRPCGWRRPVSRRWTTWTPAWCTAARIRWGRRGWSTSSASTPSPPSRHRCEPSSRSRCTPRRRCCSGWSRPGFSAARAVGASTSTASADGTVPAAAPACPTTTPAT